MAGVLGNAVLQCCVLAHLNPGSAPPVAAQMGQCALLSVAAPCTNHASCGWGCACPPACHSCLSVWQAGAAWAAGTHVHSIEKDALHAHGVRYTLHTMLRTVVRTRTRRVR